MGLMDSIDEIQRFVHAQNPPPELIAVSKNKSAGVVREAYELGLRAFGENRVQEFLTKREELEDLQIRWHFIGNLQSNKVNSIVGAVELFHGLDSMKIFRKISGAGMKLDKVTPSLIQVNISRESQKNGVLPEDLESFCRNLIIENNPHCPILGLMCIGSSVEWAGVGKVREEFEQMYKLFTSLNFLEMSNFKMKFLSMGMSSDFRLAVKYGSNMIRIGQAIFGSRF